MRISSIWPARRTFSRKLVGTILAIGLTNLVTASLFYVVNDLVDQRSTLLSRLESYGQFVASSASPGAIVLEEVALEHLVSGEIQHAELRDAEGNVLESWSPDGQAGSRIADWLDLRVERVLAPEDARGATLVAFGKSDRILSHLVVHLSTLAALGGAAMCVTFLLANRLHERYTVQLHDLVRAAKAVTTRKDYTIRTVSRGDKEFRVLSESFNYMLSEISVQQVQLEAQVEKARSGEATKSQFLATMSHEIRTPINGIMGISELLKDTQLTSEQASFTRTIYDSAGSLLRIVNDVLDFSKIEAGHIEIVETEFTLSDVINGCLETVATLSHGKDIQVLRDVRPGVPAVFAGDPQRIRQVLLNLLSNALKFTEQGEIVLRVSSEDLGWLRFEVQDTGVGIPEDRIGKLFNSFSQVDSAYNRQYEGTGLGLAISKQIVEAMGGAMFVQTKQAVGSIFGFRVKLGVINKQAGRRARVVPMGLRILLADSDARHREMLAADLRSEDFLVTEELGESARGELDRAVLEGQGFDLCLVGVELLQGFLRGGGALPGIPLIVMHPVSSRPLLPKIPWPGTKAAMARPVHVDNLHWCIGQILRSEPAPVPEEKREQPEPTAALPAGTEPDSHASADSDALGGLEVLVAEDNAVNQLIVRRFLQKLGVTCTVVADGQEAVDATRAKTYDLIFMDIQMPVMDGVEAVRIIREEEVQGARLAIAALTANVMTADRDYYLGAGFDYHLPKPLRFEALEEFLTGWVQSRSANAMEG